MSSTASSAPISSTDVLTPAGTRTLGSASEMEAAAAQLGRGGPDDSPRALVRINAPPGPVQHFLIERLATLTARHPSLDIELASDFRVVSLERRETDIAPRFGRPEDGDVLARSVATLRYGLFAAPSLAARLEAGAESVFVGFDEANAHLPEAAWLARHFPKARLALRGGSYLAQTSAASAGAGIALLPNFIGRADPALGPCRPAHTPPAREIWLLTRRDARKDLPTRTVADHLGEVFADAADELA
ncbi:LysR family transcriptional regulator [Burkholderia gladioli]|uniref:LysR family transcriptional regulator n=1 Tax=Burkholderia gladioli TaxID=28095 RepID=UPI000A3DD73B|nr:LysR substrate-binding domain-containing protein [Burkholderia gladioli]MDA0571079.1 substrate-binding domain-containing protein [Burkholderia gladioli]MDA0599065.1 substrate-binding domain-containing protein [Burkholderia gladioli]